MEKRFRFFSIDGMAKGVADTDDFHEALEKAKDYDCEVYDTELDRYAVRIIYDHFEIDADWKEANDELHK
jgi:hypothetical protein